MKKGFVLIDVIIAFALTAIILVLILSVSVYSSKIINKSLYETKIQNDFSQVEFFFQSFINSSETIDVISEEKLENELGETLEFSNKELKASDELVLKTIFLNEVTISKNNNVLTIQYIFLNDNTQETLIYYVSYYVI